jgi:hypothetical protein
VCGEGEGGDRPAGRRGWLAGDFFNVVVVVVVNFQVGEIGKNAVIDHEVDLVQTCLKDFVAYFGEVELFIKRLQELGLLFQGWSESRKRTCLGVDFEIGIIQVVCTTILSSRTLSSSFLYSADVGVASGQVVFNRDSLITNITLYTRRGTVFVLVFQPFTTAKFDDGTTVTFNV